MKSSNHEINHVTDTAIWVAAYRAEESLRSDSLFKDDFASLLIGDSGKLLATRTQGSRYTAWSVVIRTVIIDNFIKHLLTKNIDTVLNLGAGLDTRPYRMDLPLSLKWIEVDFPQIIEYKNDKLKYKDPRCKLERMSLDLSVEKNRTEFFKKVSSESKNVLVITEGVIPYLTNHDARSLADSLFAQTNFSFWITEYYSPEILEFLRTPKRLNQMKNSPFLFYPDNWFNFFKESGWNEIETKYFGIESINHGRTAPTPGWLKNTKNSDMEKIEAVKKYLAYSIYDRN